MGLPAASGHQMGRKTTLPPFASACGALPPQCLAELPVKAKQLETLAVYSALQQMGDDTQLLHSGITSLQHIPRARLPHQRCEDSRRCLFLFVVNMYEGGYPTGQASLTIPVPQFQPNQWPHRGTRSTALRSRNPESTHKKSSSTKSLKNKMRNESPPYPL
uniref:LOW QUALITY PROTEIN: putative uncharacterized protein encoded by LINC00242 n=1 Tax=Callithrix jacchus TaxID=9483 RepID=UPI0023DD2C20|nr:LOW QUALITY PROTEIN: putative uncharacterized protein encoded by LINC00242 [Callithrix jacchus]